MKQLIRIIGLLILGGSQYVYAHAVVTDYSLKMQPIQANSASTVELRFNSKIEPGLSQVFLVSKGDKHTLLAIAAGQSQGQLRVAVPPLSDGDYALRLKVFASDGHLTEDVIHFKVGAAASDRK